MKKLLTSAVLAAATLFVVPVGVAQTGSAGDRGDYSGLLPASKMEDADVKNMQDEEIGEIEEILVDPKNGKIRYAVLEVGGFLGIGETEVAVPFEALRVNKDGNEVKFVIDATKERLEKAPRVEGKRYDRLFNQRDAEPTYTYWGITWYDFGVSPTASPSPGRSGAASSPAPMSTPAAAAMTSPKAGSSPMMTPAAAATPSPSPKQR